MLELGVSGASWRRHISLETAPLSPCLVSINFWVHITEPDIAELIVYINPMLCASYLLIKMQRWLTCISLVRKNVLWVKERLVLSWVIWDWCLWHTHIPASLKYFVIPHPTLKQRPLHVVEYPGLPMDIFFGISSVNDQARCVDMTGPECTTTMLQGRVIVK